MSNKSVDTNLTYFSCNNVKLKINTRACLTLNGVLKKMNTQPELKDYFCPFCHAKLFRGHVNEFKMVCQECNRLVDSRQLSDDPGQKEESSNQA